MSNSVAVKYVLPFLQWFGLMVVIAITTDFILHKINLLYTGYYLGYPGVLLIMISFIYSFRKRKIIKNPAPKKLLILHEYLAWAGSILILIHAGIHFNSLLPWFGIIMMLVSVISGLTGKFLLKKSTDALKDKRIKLIQSGFNDSEADKELFFDSITVELMRKWRVIHIPITVLFTILALMHIISVIIFSK